MEQNDGDIFGFSGPLNLDPIPPPYRSKNIE